MKKLAIVYYLTKLSDNLKSSLEFLINSKSKDIELILVNSNTDEKIEEYLMDLYAKGASFKKINIFENLGHSYAYNIALASSKSEYIYFANSRIVWDDKLLSAIMKELNGKAHHDLYTFAQGEKEFTKKHYDKICLRELALKYYIFNCKYLFEKEQFFVNYHHYHNLFIFESLVKAKTIGCINLNLDKHLLPRAEYSYNIYDILSSSEMIYDLINKYGMDGDEKENTMAIVIFAVLHDFLQKMLRVNPSADAFSSSIINASNLITRLCPDYKQNKFITKHANDAICKYILNFVPTVKYIKKELN